MNRLTISSESEAETYRTGVALAGHLHHAVTIGLIGALGAGKTQLAKAIGAGLGIPADDISSPTFTICQEYRGADQAVFHIDLYRVDDEDALIELGLEQWTESSGITLIEWADRFSDVRDLCDLLITIEVGEEENDRLIQVLAGRSDQLFRDIVDDPVLAPQ